MSRPTRFGALLLAATLTLGGLASAQTTASPPAGGSAGLQPSLQALERRAARLTLVNSLPEADRAQATQLLDRAEALRQRARSLRIEELQAYIAALQAGDAPMTARVQAQQKVSDTRLALTKDIASLRSDVQAFVQKVPQARALLRELVGVGNRAGGGGGLGFGRGLGHGFGHGFGYGESTMPGMQGIRPSQRGWRDAPWPGASRMPQPGQRPWGTPGNRTGPRGPWSGQSWNGQPQNGMPQNNTPQNSTPQNSTPQSAPPSSGGGS